MYSSPPHLSQPLPQTFVFATPKQRLQLPFEHKGKWIMDPFSFASSEALDEPVNIKM
jgi:hypothetical protein